MLNAGIEWYLWYQEKIFHLDDVQSNLQMNSGFLASLFLAFCCAHKNQKTSHGWLWTRVTVVLSLSVLYHSLHAMEQQKRLPQQNRAEHLQIRQFVFAPAVVCSSLKSKVQLTPLSPAMVISLSCWRMYGQALGTQSPYSKYLSILHLPEDEERGEQGCSWCSAEFPGWCHSHATQLLQAVAAEDGGITKKWDLSIGKVTVWTLSHQWLSCASSKAIYCPALSQSVLCCAAYVQILIH